MSESEFQKLIKGDIVITKNIANKLEASLGVQAQFWLNLESNYQEDKKGGNIFDISYNNGSSS